MTLLLEGLRCKRGSWTPEYQLTRLIFSFRDHQSPYHACKAGFELKPHEATSLVTLQAAMDAHDFDFLDQILETYNPDIGQYADLFQHQPLQNQGNIQKQLQILTWHNYQQQDAKRRNIQRKQHIFHVTSGGWCLFNFLDPNAAAFVRLIAGLGCFMVGLHAYLEYDPPQFRSYAHFKARLHRE